MAFNEEESGLTEQKGKSLSKDIANGAKRKTQDAAKKAFKKLMTKLIMMLGIKLILLFAIVLVSIIILVAVLWFMKIGDGKKNEQDKGNVPYVVSETMKTATIIKDSNGKYSIGFEFEKDGKKTILNFDASLDMMLKTLKENGDKISTYLTNNTEKQKEFIKMLMEAEIATTFPKLGDTGLQGKIVFIRKFDKDTQKELKFIPKEEFDQKISEGSTDVLDYFTLDEDMAAIVASKSNVQKLGNGSEISNITTVQKCSPINYKMALKKYTLSFDYLWAMLVETGDLGFVSKLSNLAIDSEVQVGVLDEKKVTTTIEQESYDEKDVIYSQLLIKTKGSSAPTSITAPTDEEIIGTVVTENKTITTNITPKVDIIYAKTWLADYTNSYGDLETTSTGSLDVDLKNMNKDDIEGEEQNLGSSNITEEYKEQSDSPNNVERVTKTSTSKRVQYNFKYGSTTYTENSVYGSSTKTTVEKTDKDSEEENAVKLLVNSYKALDSLKETLSWLCDMLEGNENAEYMIDITKYLLYKATGKDYGVTELSLDDIKVVTSTNSVSSGMGTGYWWPVGGSEITEKDGKYFALGEPELGMERVSRAGKSGSKYNGNTGEYHEYREGAAVDIASLGQVGVYNVISIAKGTVISCGDGCPDVQDPSANGGMGNYCQVDYGNGMIVRFMHMAQGSLKVSVGETLDYGQVIGKIGHSGDSSGPHLHVDICINGVYVDATEYLDPSNPRSSGGATNLIQFIYKGSTPPYNSDKTKYKMYDDGGGVATIGAADINYQAHRNLFPDDARSYIDGKLNSTDGVNRTGQSIDSLEIYVDISVVDQVGYQILEGDINYVKSYVADLNLEQYQIDALVAATYHYGQGGVELSLFKQAYQQYGSGIELWNNWWYSNGFHYYGYSASTFPGWLSQNEYRYELFTTGNYDLPLYGRELKYYTSAQLSQLGY